MAEDSFLVNPPKRRRKRRVTRKSRARKGIGRAGSRHRPVVYTVGKRWKTSPRAKIARRGVFVNPGLALVGNPRRRRRRSTMKSYRRRYRRNPAITLRGFTGRVQSVLPLAVTGIASRVITGMVPGMIGIVNPWARLGVKAAVAVFGGQMVGTMMKGQHGTIWTVVAMADIVSDLMTQFMPGIIPGLGNYMDYNDQIGYGDTGASAFPEEVAAFPEEVAQYPYDGAHEYGY